MISPSQNSVDSPLSNVPPRNKYWPSGANKETPVNEANIMLDRRSAFGTIVGLILIARSSRGPIPNPEKKAKPRSIESLIPRFLPLSGVKKSPNASAAPRRAKPEIFIVLISISVRGFLRNQKYSLAHV